ncbi:unnamed protein product [Commensalibacter communis]|uniref:hypothetical protein n=1 Tax=Commensalibacter communis TaxID=2972786 RepID=UPI0022FF5547|nr:hypothetical protein [Commensalibacter communis]CAI3924214.1 unnamed protein product [Commensalibacter communis]
MNQQRIENTPSVKGNPSILLGTMEITKEEATTLGISSKRTIQIFGAKIPTGKIYDGIETWYVNFLIIETDKNQKYSSILAQLTSSKITFYCTINGDNILSSSICGDMFNVKKIRCLRRPPKWKHYDSEIPMIENQTAFLLGQSYIKKERLEKNILLVEKPSIYLQ